ncbi:MAG: coenzyme F430 synthase [Methanobacterium sp.]|nr:coenzyme F430 synthase [Methanobacterium sp.]
MKILIVDMTHGGTIIASEFLKIPNIEVYAWDIYSTMEYKTKIKLENKGLKFIEKEYVDKLISEKNIYTKPDLLLIAPIHCKLEYKTHITHHQAVGFLLKNKINTPIIEVTGVKGKTSVVWILKEIFKDLNPLILSSLGVEVIENNKWKLLKKNISITPASIIEAWNISKEYEIGICIFETSLGGTGLADVGIITNIAENYSIANNSTVASYAKMQIFQSKRVACDLDSFNRYYSQFHEKTNTFDNGKIKTKNPANITATQIRLGFDKTNIKIDITNFKTLTDKIINEHMEISTFAPAPIHINNILAAISASLILETPLEKIKQGLNNFKGVKGRTSTTEYNGIRIIEEINPGLNVTAVKKALSMTKDMKDLYVIFGGKYGVTCEEIDEKSVSKVLDKIENNITLILTDELGAEVKKNLNRNYIYLNDLNKAITYASKNTCSNILIIYRSNYSDIKKR